MFNDVMQFLADLLGKLVSTLFNLNITGFVSLGMIFLIFIILGIVLYFVFGIIKSK